MTTLKKMIQKAVLANAISPAQSFALDFDQDDNEMIQKAILANEVSPAQSFTFGFDQKTPDRNYLFHNSFNDPKEMTIKEMTAVDHTFPKNEELSDEHTSIGSRLHQIIKKYTDTPDALQKRWRKDYGIYPMTDEQIANKVSQAYYALKKHGYDPDDAHRNGIDLLNNNLPAILENGETKYNPYFIAAVDGMIGDNAFPYLQTLHNSGYPLSKALNPHKKPEGDAQKFLQMQKQKNPNHSDNLSPDELETYKRTKKRSNFGTDITFGIGNNIIDLGTVGLGRGGIDLVVSDFFSSITGQDPFEIYEKVSNTQSQYVPSNILSTVDRINSERPRKKNKYMKDKGIENILKLFTDDIAPALIFNETQRNKFYNAKKPNLDEIEREQQLNSIDMRRSLSKN